MKHTDYIHYSQDKAQWIEILQNEKTS